MDQIPPPLFLSWLPVGAYYKHFRYAAKVFLLLRDLIHSKKSEMEDSQTYWTALHMIAFDQFCSFVCNSAHFAQKAAQKYTLVTLLNCGQTMRRREVFY